MAAIQATRSDGDVRARDRRSVGADVGQQRRGGSSLVHIAKEGQIFVVGVSAFLRGCDVPRDLSDADSLYGGEDDFMSRGNSSIVAPGGELIAGPLIGEAGVVSAELDLSRIASGRRMFDPIGHYARPDVLSLETKGF